MFGCFPGMTASLAKNTQIIGCTISAAFFLKFSYFSMFLNIQTDLIILKTDDEQFTLTTRKLLHITFKYRHTVKNLPFRPGCIWAVTDDGD